MHWTGSELKGMSYDDEKKQEQSVQGSELGEAAKDQFLVYQAEVGKLKLVVRHDGETVWLTQPLMAELSQTTQPNISPQRLTF